ncbi:hypothetical protein ABB37_09113 [Leptomonas pyrrhocoris]|uniref:Uncharacterized protein n=1 Tax=Leptomonas pyrrhocoris TaxID=157538 RepID=A0A0N0DRB5_LEPPY|nr:hypothetical protein ABB37_09113 [Leptomonas pyrrhocoris]KPA74412.1 hypothetical protein ABB37_09113 [Leptomonas pyrrhocoris]|eukprot:XP_015652851.1 hypothetical protein ABB37_09113 [Leptomonas pyrrhocoris]
MCLFFWQLDLVSIYSAEELITVPSDVHEDALLPKCLCVSGCSQGLFSLSHTIIIASSVPSNLLVLSQICFLSVPHPTCSCFTLNSLSISLFKSFFSLPTCSNPQRIVAPTRWKPLAVPRFCPSWTTGCCCLSPWLSASTGAR